MTTKAEVTVIDGDGLIGETGRTVKLAVARVEDTVAAANQFVMFTALFDTDALGVTRGRVQLALAPASA